MSIEQAIQALTDPVEAAYLAERRQTRRRILLVVVAAVGAVTLAVGWKAGRHISASLWLEACHYRVAWGIDPSNRYVGGGTSVKSVPNYWGITATTAPNDDLKYLTSLHRVEELDLSQAYHLTDPDLAILDRLPTLRLLNLDRSRTSAWASSLDNPGRLTNATLARIKGLKNLQELNLGGHPITDAGLANLSGLVALEAIELRLTRITDAGLEPLKALPRLKSLDLTGTNVTARGIQDFETARPDVKVIDDAAIGQPVPTPAPK